MTPPMPCQRYQFSNNRMTLQLVQYPLHRSLPLLCQMPQPGTILLPPVTPWIRDKIISGEFVNFATPLPNAMFSGSTGTKTSKSLTVQLTAVSSPPTICQKDKFFCIMDGAMEYISCYPYQPFPSTCSTTNGIPKNYNFI